MSNVLVPADKCSTMTEVRAAIDALDQEIVTLLAERMRYIEAAARIKPQRDLVRDEPRKAEVLAKVAATASEAGLPLDLAAGLYEQLVEYSIAHELARFDARN